MKKSAFVYKLILGFWVILIAIAGKSFFIALNDAHSTSKLVFSLVVISCIFISYFWLNGMKDIVYTLFYFIYAKKEAYAPPTRKAENLPKVALVYCTCNDFNDESLRRSMSQDYPNFFSIILDDSRNKAYQKKIDDFAKEHSIEVIRRPDNIGYKAGNLNNYLHTADYDYFVILDSDEIIPKNFITRALDYFDSDEKTGIVQATHIATRNCNHFMQIFSIGVDSHWPTYQVVKEKYGFLSLLGHGAMIKKECFDSAGGFPHLVAEDLCFSIEARRRGYYVAFAQDITCEEEYPVSYLAFKKRHSKWSQGNMEFIKRYTRILIAARLTWFEKLDIFLFTYNLPLTSIFSIYIIINVIVLPILHYHLRLSPFLLIPTIIFLFAPMLNDVLFHGKSMGLIKMLKYIAHAMLLYGSLLFISIYCSLKSVFGKAVFLVTPKNQLHLSVSQGIILNKYELIFAFSLSAVSILLDKSIAPVLLIVLPALSTVYLSSLSNKQASLAKT